MITSEWALTAQHCVVPNGPALPNPPTFTVTHPPTGVSQTSTLLVLNPDLSQDVALIKFPPLDVDPSDPNPTVVPLFAGDDSEAVGGVESVYGYGWRDQYSLMDCQTNADCYGFANGRCDAITGAGRSQCYDIRNKTSTGSCSSKTGCSPGSDCDEARGLCYAPNLLTPVSPQQSCVGNGGCPGNLLCSNGLCATPSGCATEDHCYPGFVCSPQSNMCIMPSTLADSSDCNPSFVCSFNSQCSGTDVCIDHRCCNGKPGLRTADLPVVPVARNNAGLGGAYAWNGKIMMPDCGHPNRTLSGDSGGPHFFNDQVLGVTSNCMVEPYAGAFRDWVKSTISPQGTLFIDPRTQHGFFGAGTDTMKTADLNGDGRSDLLWFRPTTFLGTPVNQVSVSFAAANGNYGAEIVTTARIAPNFPVEIADVTGDGADDLVVLTTTTNDAIPLTWTGADLSSAGIWAHNQFFIWNGDKVRMGDVNGDGSADLVNFSVSGHVYVSFACGTNAGQVPIPGCNGAVNRFGSDQNWVLNFGGGASFVGTGDFDGDGYGDVIAINGSTAQVALAQTKNCTTDSQCTDFCHKWIGKCRADLGQPPAGGASWGTFAAPTAIADINGDRSDDLLYVNQTTGKVTVAFADPRGSGGARFKPVRTISSSFCQNTLCVPGDNNGDGRDDVIKFIRDSVTGQAARDVVAGIVP